MTVQEIANKLVDYCRQGKYEEAQNELYAQNAKSIEPEGTQGPALVEGLDGIKQKSEQWANMVEEIHSNEVSDPVVAGNYFAVSSKTEATFKGQGRTTMEEVSVYEVQDGKITSERFFYPVQPKQ